MRQEIPTRWPAGGWEGVMELALGHVKRGRGFGAIKEATVHQYAGETTTYFERHMLVS